MIIPRLLSLAITSGVLSGCRPDKTELSGSFCRDALQFKLMAHHSLVFMTRTMKIKSSSYSETVKLTTLL